MLGYATLATLGFTGPAVVRDGSLAGFTRPAHSPVVPVQMGGLTGLPRIPPKALALTKKFNPGGSYSEPIATLWRDLETLYGIEGVVTGGSRTGIDASRLGRGESTGKFRGMTYSVDQRAQMVLSAVKKDPNMLNPEISNRFVFAQSKAILVEKLGSEQAAIAVMKADPSILREGEALEDMSVGKIKSRMLMQQMAPAALVATGAALTVAADGSLGLGLGLADALPAGLVDALPALSASM